MKLSINFDTAKMAQEMDDIGRNLMPYAISTALTKIAKTAASAVQSSMKTGFDRPTPYTVNSLFVTPATKTNLVAEVKIKDRSYKGSPASTYLSPEIEGGSRNLKRSEILLNRKGILPGGMMIVPGSEARLDQYGNLSRGQMSQILSAVSGFGEMGFLVNKSFRRGARQNKTTDDIFAITKKTGSLVPGVYMRTPSGPKPLLIFVADAHYRARLPFGQTVSAVALADLETEFDRAFDALMAKYGDASFET